MEQQKRSAAYQIYLAKQQRLGRNVEACERLASRSESLHDFKFWCAAAAEYATALRVLDEKAYKDGIINDHIFIKE